MANETETEASPLLRSIPSVSSLLSHALLKQAGERHASKVVALTVRSVLSEVRTSLSASKVGSLCPCSDELAERVAARLDEASNPSLQCAINGTGIVLHTGLGRARLHADAVKAIADIGNAHSTLEIDTETGARGSRQNHVSSLLCELTGAEAAAVVNNCAGAVLLAVTALAVGKEVILSRGEMVEIGGAFRMPDIIKACGAKLVEVGTTNRTRIADYRKAITDQTGLILRCHPSNYRIVGFTESATSEELIALGRNHDIPVMEDQGSGAIIDPVLLGLSQHHGSLPRSVREGYDIITASGDKLMGATQAGILLGSSSLIESVMGHALARALRVDKLTLAGLEATLKLYRDPAKAIDTIPTLRYIARTEADIRKAAVRLKNGLCKSLPANLFAISLVPEHSQAGGGSLPGDNLPTTCVSIRTLTPSDSVDNIAALLRGSSPPVFGRIKDNGYLLDPRTMENFEIDIVAQAALRLVKPD